VAGEVVKGDHADGCGKVLYETRAIAKDALKSIVRMHGGQGLKVYSCDRCPYWHIGRGRRSKSWRRSRESGGAARRRHTDLLG
jgi:hypothetical protein